MVQQEELPPLYIWGIEPLAKTNDISKPNI